MTRIARMATTGAAALAVAGALAPAALAHVELKSTTPKAHSTVKAPPSVRMTFSGPIRSASLTVTGPGGKIASKGHGGRDPRNINRALVPLRSGLASGRYTVKASVVAADGHKETFTFWFKVTR
jgi:methionine-rich copper-binding protein CopC